MYRLSGSLGLVLLAWLPMASAADPGAAVSDRIQPRIDAALLELAEHGELPAGDGAAPARLSVPPRRHYDLGAVIDLAGGDGEGLRVLGVTPGGGAEGIGLRTGDRLLVLNGLRLDRAGVESGTIRSAIAAADGAVQVEVLRDGRRLELEGYALPVDLPAYSLTIQPLPGGCGRVSTFTSMPRSEKLFPIELRRIDGIEQARGVSSYRLSAGRHVLMLQEGIPDIELDETENLQRRQLRQRRMAEYKFFEIDVQPDTTYFLAARLADSPRDVIDNAHWRPVIWRVKPERCGRNGR